MSKNKKAKPFIPEWSRMFDVDTLGNTPERLSITANEEERKALAKRFSLDAIDTLHADVIISRDEGSVEVEVSGKFTADITQKCVVSLEPVKTTIEEEITGLFTDDTHAVSFSDAKKDMMVKKGHTEVEISLEDGAEKITDGKIDIGEFVAQNLSLAIDPYPHAPGASEEFLEQENKRERDRAAAIRKNPFEALKDWRD